MPTCYVVVAYHTLPQEEAQVLTHSQLVDPTIQGELQVLEVFLDQIKARKYVERYHRVPGQHIVTFTSWLNDDDTPAPKQRTYRTHSELRRLDGLHQIKGPDPGLGLSSSSSS